MKEEGARAKAKSWDPAGILRHFQTPRRDGALDHLSPGLLPPSRFAHGDGGEMCARSKRILRRTGARSGSLRCGGVRFGSILGLLSTT
jgi:hypothetical protein